jgi:hypothetical protein
MLKTEKTPNFPNPQKTQRGQPLDLEKHELKSCCSFCCWWWCGGKEEEGGIKIATQV